MMHADSNFTQNMGRQLGAILGGMNNYPTNIKKITNEHALQFGGYTRLMAAVLDAPPAKYETVRDWLSNNIFQVALADLPGVNNQEGLNGGKPYPEGFEGVFDPTETKEAWDAKSQMEPFLRDKLQDFLDDKITKAELDKISSLTRYFNEYFYRNPNNVTLYNTKTGKIESVSKIYDTQVPRQTYIGLKGERLSARDLEAVNTKTGVAVYPLSLIHI